MPGKFKEGDRVQVLDRPATADDAKSGLFYNHFRGLTGAVQKAYESSDEISVTIDESSMPQSIRNRHAEIRQAMKSKWLDSLSEEARGRLTDAEKNFKLRYSILVREQDLAISQGPPPDDTPAQEDPALAAGPPAETVRRKTSAEIEAAEAEYQRNRKQREEQAHSDTLDFGQDAR